MRGVIRFIKTKQGGGLWCEWFFIVVLKILEDGNTPVTTEGQRVPGIRGIKNTSYGIYDTPPLKRGCKGCKLPMVNLPVYPSFWGMIGQDRAG